MHHCGCSAFSIQQHRGSFPEAGGVTTCDPLSFFLRCGITLVHLFKKQELSIKKKSLRYDPAGLYCLHRNIHNNLWISTCFHLCLGQVIYKHDNDDKGLLFLRLLDEWLLAAHCPLCLLSGRGIRKRNGDTPQYSSSLVFQLRDPNLPPVWGNWETVESSTPGLPTPPPFPCSFLPPPSPNPPPALSHSLHSSHRPLSLPLKH